MNTAVSPELHSRFRMLIDIGCLEHLFDTRQALENCMRLLSVGGHYVLHTPVRGYHMHGLHTFNPEGLLGALRLNGFDVLEEIYTGAGGRGLRSTLDGYDVILWTVGRKTRELETFVSPQQGE